MNFDDFDTQIQSDELATILTQRFEVEEDTWFIY